MWRVGVDACPQRAGWSNGAFGGPGRREVHGDDRRELTVDEALVDSSVVGIGDRRWQASGWCVRRRAHDGIPLP